MLSTAFLTEIKCYFRSSLRTAFVGLKAGMEDLDLASHGFMGQMMNLTLAILEHAIKTQVDNLE